MDGSDWSNVIRHHTLDTRSDTESESDIYSFVYLGLGLRFAAGWATTFFSQGLTD